MKIYDMAIIGGGPGGYSAALYAARAGLATVVIEKLSAGGQMALTHEIDNYPGFDEGIDGFELGDRMQRQADYSAGDGKMVDRIVLQELLGQLTPRERQLIVLRYFQDKTQVEVAKRLGISQVQVSRMEKRILLRMRQKMT